MIRYRREDGVDLTATLHMLWETERWLDTYVDRRSLESGKRCGLTP